MKFFIGCWLVLIGFFVSAEPYSVFEENGLFGLKNNQGAVIIPPVYEALGWSNGDFSVIQNYTGYQENGRWGILSLANQKVTASLYYSLYPGTNQLLVASIRSASTLRISTGCVDLSGKEIIPFQYSGIKIFPQRAVTYTLENNRLIYGLIDLSGRSILPQQYQNIYPIGSLRYAVQNFQDKTALFTENGKAVTGFVIDSISVMHQGLYIFYQDGKQGLLDRQGNIIKQALFRDITVQENIFSLRLPNTWRIINSSNQVIRTLEADSVVHLSGDRIKIISPSGVHLTDVDFKMLTQEPVDEIFPFAHGLAVFKKNENAGILRDNGSILVPSEFHHLTPGKNFIIAEQLQFGRKSSALLDLQGNMKTKKLYDRIDPPAFDLFPVKKNGFWGAVDHTGREVLACTYDSLIDVHENMVVVKFMDGYGIITSNEQWLVTPQKNPIKVINRERYFERDSSLTYLKSITGETLYFSTNSLTVDGHHLKELTSTGSVWTISLNGIITHREEPAKESAEKVFPSSEGYRGIIRNGRYGFIDEQGRLRIANRYEGAQPFLEGLAAIKLRGRWGFIDKDENIIIQPIYDSVEPFQNGWSRVRRNNLFGLIDRSGNELLECRYDRLEILKTGRVLISEGGKAGLADLHGNILIQPKYDYLQDLGNDLVLVQLFGKYGVVNTDGLSLIPIQYDYLWHESLRNIFIALVKGETQRFRP